VLVGYAHRAEAAASLARQIAEAGGIAEPCKLDLLDESSIAAAVGQAVALAGGVAAAIYSAGFRKTFDFISRVSDEDWDKALTMDVRGFAALARGTLPELRKSKGAIVSTTTYQGARLEPKGCLSSVPKAAVERATMVIAREEGRYGVRANAVRTGWMDAGSAAALLDEPMHAQKLMDIPLGRVGRPEELGEVVAFLASNRAGFVTGSVVTCDGGEGL
jgi:NAD(P)-dependent dehydrogenase (short-subunit alcohol dehydrogenase family)